MDYQAVIHKKEVNFPVLIYITDTQKHYSEKIKGIAESICYNPIYVKKGLYWACVFHCYEVSVRCQTLWSPSSLELTDGDHSPSN